MVERLVPVRTQILGDRLVPFLAIGEDRIDIEDHAAEIEQAVPNNLADSEIGMRDRRRLDGGGEVGEKGLVSGHHPFNVGPAKKRPGKADFPWPQAGPPPAWGQALDTPSTHLRAALGSEGHRSKPRHLIANWYPVSALQKKNQ